MINNYNAVVIKKTLSQENVVHLHEFFLDKKIFDIAGKLKFKKDIEQMEHKYMSASSAELDKKLNDKAFLKFISSALGKPVKKIRYEVIELGHTDYCLSHDKKMEIIIDSSAHWNNNYGGGLMFNDGDGNVLKIPHAFNSLIISNGKTFRYIKYVNNHAGKNKKVLIIGRLS